MFSKIRKSKIQLASSGREFQSWWTNEYGMINNGDKAVCVLCSKTVVSRTFSVKRHYETNHAKIFEKEKEEQKEIIAQALKNKNMQSAAIKRFVSNQSNVTASSFIISNVIAKRGKPFNDGDYVKEALLKCAPILFEDFDNKEKIIQRIKDLSLTRNTVKDRILVMAKNITYQQKMDINSADFLSLCLDESTDISGSARLAIFIRFCVGDYIKEELVGIASLETTTKGTDICKAVVNELTEKEINLNKIVSITTDGARSMIGKENGFLNLFTKQIGHPVLGFHCIIHQQVLCAKTSFRSLEHIMMLVTKVVNFISARALNKRRFLELLKEINSVYNGLLMYSNVRWLSRGKVLQRFVECLDEIRLFLHNEKVMEQYSQLLDVEWVCKLMFFTDLCLHLNDLNVKLQGINKTIIVMFDLIEAFSVKLQVFNRDVISNAFRYFPNTKKVFLEFQTHENLDQVKITQEFSEVIQEISNEFVTRFQDFRHFSETSKFILYPDTIEVDKLNLNFFEWLNFEDLEMELIEFQASSTWKQKFVDLRKNIELIENDRLLNTIKKNAEHEIRKTWNTIPTTFKCLKKLATLVLSIFSSTYACESLFSEISFIKNSYRNKLTGESSAACALLKVTTYEPDIQHLASKVQQQKSH